MPRINAGTNPTAGVDLTNLRGNSGLARVTGLVGPPRSTGTQVTVGTGAFSGFMSVGAATGFTAGEIWSAVKWVHITRARALRIYLAVYNGSSFVATQATGRLDLTPVASTWTQVRVVQAVPSGTATHLNLHTDVPVSDTASMTLTESSTRLERIDDPSIVYADGASPGWGWDGTAHLSSSQELPAGPEPGRFLLTV